MFLRVSDLLLFGCYVRVLFLWFGDALLLMLGFVIWFVNFVVVVVGLIADSVVA